MIYINILAINPGSTSTKISIFNNERAVFEENIQHDSSILSDYIDKNGDVLGQKEYRKKLILDILDKNDINLENLNAIVGRGGRLKPLESGTYRITKEVLNDIPYPLVHPALLGTIIAKEIADTLSIPSFFVDPTSVDETLPIVKITGIKGVKRKIYFHALNQKSVARKLAKDLNKNYEDLNLIVAHMGGGITVAAHNHGKILDLTTPSSGEGPFAPQRAGMIDGTDVVELAFSGKYSKAELMSYFTSSGGLKSLLGTSDLREVENQISQGDKEAESIFNALAYQVSKSIFSMGAILNGKVDAIGLTGGLSYSDKLVEHITKYCEKFSKIYVYPGENEMLALVEGTLRVLRGEEEAKIY